MSMWVEMEKNAQRNKDQDENIIPPTGPDVVGSSPAGLKRNIGNRKTVGGKKLRRDQSDEVPDEQEEEAQQQEEHPQFGLHTRNYDNDIKEMKLKMANLEAKNQTLQAKVENLELRTENRALKENAEQKANYQALEAKLKAQFGKILAAENGKQATGSNQMKLDYMWGHLMSKVKIVANSNGNGWNGLNTNARISKYGLKATSNVGYGKHVFATKGCPISEEQCREENFQFPGTIIFYYEVTITSAGYQGFSCGFTDGSIPADADADIGDFPNSYVLVANYVCWLSGKEHEFECQCPIEEIAEGSVLGCGLLLNSKNKLAVFFTVNGTLLDLDRLYPTVYINDMSVEANFGDNLVTKPFKFDIDKCSGLVFE